MSEDRTPRPLLERLFGVTEDRMVEVLRAVHRSRAGAPLPRPLAGAGAGAAPLLALLRALRPPALAEPPRRETPRLPLEPAWETLAEPRALPEPAPRDTAPRDTAPDWGSMPLRRDPEPEPYERARAHFAGVEERLRGEARVSDALIDELRGREPASSAPAPAPPPRPAPTSAPRQQSLQLLALAGGVAGGRFVVANDRREPLSPVFDHTGLRRVDEGGAAVELEPEVRFEPASPTLVPGASAVVRIWIDLSELPPLTGRYELCVDVMSGERCAQKLFVDLEIHAPHTPNTPTGAEGPAGG